MTDARHSKQSPSIGGVHVIQAYEYANASARTGASGFVSADIGKVARQTDNNTFWVLTAVTPTWSELTGAASSDELAKVSSNDTTAGYLNGKLVAGSGITLTENNNGSNETLTIAASGGGSFDQRDVLIWDHFLTSNLSTTSVGSHGWRVSNTGTGSNVTTVFEDGRPGVIRLTGGTAAAARAALYMGDSSNGTRFVIGSKGGALTFEALIKFPASGDFNAANLERFQLGFGLDWSADTELADGVYCRFTPGVDTNFALVLANGGTRTVQAGITAPAAGVWVRVGIVITMGATPTAELYINGVSQGSAISTNMPTQVSLGMKMQSAGGAAASSYIDYCLVTQTSAKEGS